MVKFGVRFLQEVLYRPRGGVVDVGRPGQKFLCNTG